MRILLYSLMLLATAAFGFGRQPTVDEAMDYAKSVILLQRVVKGDQIHSYVKEVWRFDPHATPPAIGSEYKFAMPYDPQMRNAERDGIAFEFGKDKPKDLPMGWRIQVMEDGRVMPFNMPVDDVRTLVKKTTPHT